MRLETAYWMALAFLIYLPCHALAQDSALPAIAIRVAAVPASEVALVGLEAGGSTIVEDSEPFVEGQARSFTIEPDNSLFRSTLYGTWDDGSTQSIPFFRLTTFGGLRPLNVFMVKYAIGAQTSDTAYLNSHCDGAQPANAKMAFEQIAACSPAARLLAFQSPRSANYFKALNAWFVANYYLYSGLGYKFSPYGLHEDLVQKIRDIIDFQRDYGYDDSSFWPLNINDIEKALKEYEGEPVRLMLLLPKLESQRQYSSALNIAREAREKYLELSNGSQTTSIFETNGTIIDGWIQKMERLVASQASGN